MKKIIEYYVTSNYCNRAEYIVNLGDAKIIAQLTGKKTINSVVRELIRDLTGGMVTFEEVLQPRKNILD